MKNFEEYSIEEIADWIAKQNITDPDNSLVIEWPNYIRSSGKFSRCAAYLEGDGVGKRMKTSYQGKETVYHVIGDNPKDALIKLAKLIISN